VSETAASTFDLSGRTALVTGGAGILGRRMCRGLADMGAHVAVVDLDAAGAEALAEELAAETGRPALGLAADVSAPQEVAALVPRVESELGPLRILCNNAATKGSDPAAFFAPFEEYSLATWREVVAVNLDAMFLMAQACIIQTSSIYGLYAADQRIYAGSEYEGRAINTPAVYAATKAAVVGLTRHLASYWAERGIRVNAIAPGGVESGQNETFQRNYAARVPMGRMGRADEVVGAVLFLAADASSYVTGQTLAVDGGLSAW
jgi:NAD(P)-dependent dehydrogenase (short-subunit alcohol dehydrogenase family)